MIDVKREFEFENQDIIIQMKFPEDIYYHGAGTTSEEDFIVEQLNQEIPQWDILRCRHNFKEVSEILNNDQWVKDYCVDFSSIEEFKQTVLPEILSPQYIAECKGAIPSPPIDGVNYLIWLDQKIAQKLQIVPKQFDFSFADLLEYAQKIEKFNSSNGTNYVLFRRDADWSPIELLTQHLFCSEIGDFNKLKDKNYSQEKHFAFNKIIRLLEQLSVYKPFGEQWQNNLFTKSNMMVKENNALLYLQGSWMYNIWLAEDSVNYKKFLPVALPYLKPPETYISEYRTVWIVPKDAVNKEEAIRFMLYWCKPEVLDTWGLYTKSPSGVKGSKLVTTFGLDELEVFTHTIDEKFKNNKISSDYGSGIYLGANNKSLPNYSKAVLEGSISAEEVIVKIEKQLKKY